MPSERVPAGLTAERVGFFTDAVFAIAMTLLVIEIPRPEDDSRLTVGDGVTKAEAARSLLQFLHDQTGSFIAYVLAFWMLWIVWRQHHRLLDRVSRLSPAMVGWHFPLLLFIGFLPYPTTIYGHHSDNPAAAAGFALGVGALMVCRSALQSRAIADGVLRDDVDAVEVQHGARISWIVTVYFLCTTLLAWWTPWIVGAWIIAPTLGTVIDRALSGMSRRQPGTNGPDGTVGSDGARVSRRRGPGDG